MYYFKRYCGNLILPITTALLLFITVNLRAQEFTESPIEVELDVAEQLQNAHVISLVNLGVFESGDSQVLFSAIISNITENRVSDLYLETVISSTRGVIAYIRQEFGYPFSLAPMQSVYITNNTLKQKRIPGVSETLSFESEMTPEGDRLIEKLSGSVNLPSDVYTIQLNVLQITKDGTRRSLAKGVTEIGSIVPPDDEDIFLRAPGDVIGGDNEITSLYPQFSWDGRPSNTYRLLVVKGSGEDSPESLLENAKSSAATNDGGSLLSFENLDITVRGNTFQYPVSGAQPLEIGNTYYWRVIAYYASGSGTVENASEIWSFSLKEPEENIDAPVASASEELEQALIALIGADRYNELAGSGYKLFELELDGRKITGSALSAKMAEILDKIGDGDIILGDGK